MTQVDKLHEMLMRGPVSGMDCINAGIMNYKGRVNDLRKLGIPIRTQMVTRTNTAGEKKTFALYSLEVGA